ncbi:hypothetical protein [Streptomyces sp. NPDC049881]|uniref:hypothetical protein n=1 Tax=Streptomyces sp. NPDC049881 TaxID=3155778 RepID=UPI0034434BAA
MTRPVYGEPGRFPPRHRVRPDGRHLRNGRYAWRRVPVDDLHLAAMADAYPHGRWLGGGGSTRPLRVRRAEEFMRRLGELAVRRSGGPEGVARHTPPRAAREGVPLWMARRVAPGPAGPVAVTLDPAPSRADVRSHGCAPPPAAPPNAPASPPASR